jgi:hypothetical protein
LTESQRCSVKLNKKQPVVSFAAIPFEKGDEHVLQEKSEAAA